MGRVGGEKCVDRNLEVFWGAVKSCLAFPTRPPRLSQGPPLLSVTWVESGSNRRCGTSGLAGAREARGAQGAVSGAEFETELEITFVS